MDELWLAVGVIVLVQCTAPLIEYVIVEKGYLESQNHTNDSKMILFFRKAQEIQGASWNIKK